VLIRVGTRFTPRDADVSRVWMRWVRAHLYLAFIVRLCRAKSILLDSAIGLDLVLGSFLCREAFSQEIVPSLCSYFP